MIIPTSTDTAIILQTQRPLFWSAVGYSLLLCGPYCLWEMLMSALLGRRPQVSRWIWLALAGLLLVFAAVSFDFMFGPVSFNAGGLSTAWSFILSEWCLVAALACVAIVLGLRAADALKAGSMERLPYVAWWLLGVLVMVSYGSLLAWAELAGTESDAAMAALVAGTVLAATGVGSLLIVATIRKLRSSTA